MVPSRSDKKAANFPSRESAAARSIPSKSVSDVADIGRLLFTEYAFPFEVTSILILVAMVGAVVLARREEHR